MAIELSKKEYKKLELLTDEGAEALIYKWKPGELLKIFKQKVDIKKKENKVKELVKIKFPPNIMAPIDIVTMNGNFIGYSMKMAANTENLHEITKRKNIISRKINNKQLIEIAINIGKTVEMLHKNNILIGDLSDCNILINIAKLKVYFIDVDSWGIEGKYSPDAYTEDFFDPDEIRNDIVKGFSKQTDLYAYAVLSFYILTSQHPFGGYYPKNEKMNTDVRMKSRISVLGNHNITTLKIIPKWTWMTKKLQDAFLEVFERGNRNSILTQLQEYLKTDMKCKGCKNHFSRLKSLECPICGTLNKPPVEILTKVLFEASNVKQIIDRETYVNTDDAYVHVRNQEARIKLKDSASSKIKFINDGTITIKIQNNTISLFKTKDVTQIAKIENISGGLFKIHDNGLIYIDYNSSNIMKYSIVSGETQTLFNLKEIRDGKMDQVLSRFKNDKVQIRLLIMQQVLESKRRNGDIGEYIVQYDETMQKFFLVYMQKDKKEIITGGFKGDVATDFISDLKYNSITLQGIHFYNNTVYYPDYQEIVGVNLETKKIKKFKCKEVSPYSRINIIDGKFEIINNDKIYLFGEFEKK
ncbi:MAG: serine/threonine-protein kinase [Clostridia bacterium]|nr:serine/threonine-protein kinase [Clostridia bacterium]